jgi:hypothetical protein
VTPTHCELTAGAAEKSTALIPAYTSLFAVAVSVAGLSELKPFQLAVVALACPSASAGNPMPNRRASSALSKSACAAVACSSVVSAIAVAVREVLFPSLRHLRDLPKFNCVFVPAESRERKMRALKEEAARQRFVQGKLRGDPVGDTATHPFSKVLTRSSI